MTFKQYTLIYDVLSMVTEGMKKEEDAIKKLYHEDYTKYEQDDVYKKLRHKRLEIENIIESIESMEIGR